MEICHNIHLNPIRVEMQLASNVDLGRAGFGFPVFRKIFLNCAVPSQKGCFSLPWTEKRTPKTDMIRCRKVGLLSNVPKRSWQHFKLLVVSSL